MIEQITLKNFKSFASTTIDFEPLTLVLGGNGAGKSNLFDALRFLQAIGEGRSVRDAIEGHALPGATSAAVAGVRGGSSAITHFLSDSNRFDISVSMRFGKYRRATYSLKVDCSTYRVVEEELQTSWHGGPYVYSTRPETGPLEHREGAPSIYARFYKNTRGVNPKREFSPFSFLLTQFVSRQAETRSNEDAARVVREELASLTPLELQPEALRQYSSIGRSSMGEHGENFAGAVWAMNEAAEEGNFVRDEDGNWQIVTDLDAVARRNAILAWLSEVTPRRITAITTPQSPTGEVIFAVREEPYEVDIAAPSLSDGTLRFAALALAAINNRERQTLVIEELENGINPVRLNLLMRMLEQVAETDSGTQIVASTHSPALLNSASEATAEAAVVIGWDEDEQTSRAVKVVELPAVEAALRRRTLGELQEEGWLQVAAGI